MSSCSQEDYRVLIVDRGGYPTIGEIEFTSLIWNRVRNNASTATVNIAADACDRMGELLRVIAPGRHELSIVRSGEQVWVGPIHSPITWSYQGVVIDASDCCTYLDYTSLTKKWFYDDPEDTQATGNKLERVKTIVTHELTKDVTVNVMSGNSVLVRWENQEPPVRIVPYLDIRSGTVGTTSRTEAFQMTVGEHLRGLARTGMNFTFLGRSLIAWDVNDPIGYLRTLTIDDFTEGLQIIFSGDRVATWSHVVAENDQEKTLTVGSAYNDIDDFYGPWERIKTTESEAARGDEALETLCGQAERDLIGRVPAGVEIDSRRVSAVISEGWDIPDMVPGMLAPVSITLPGRTFGQNMTLSEVTVTVGSEGERVGVNLIPFAGSPQPRSFSDVLQDIMERVQLLERRITSRG